MDPITLLLLAFGLSADAFAVSVTNGICFNKITKKNAVHTALTFGIFQASMPIIGFILGRTFSNIINIFQHWIALILLCLIGINMIRETYSEWKHPEESCSVINVFSPKNLIIQGIATSIDAMAAGVGISYAITNTTNIIVSAVVIGTITFICSFIGVYIGRKFGLLLGLRARLTGGIILILIGLRIFISHQMQL